MAVKEKKKTKQKGGLSEPLSTIFRNISPNKNNKTIEILYDYFNKNIELLQNKTENNII